MTAPARGRGGEGGEGGEGGRGGGGGGAGEGGAGERSYAQDFGAPSHRQPKSIGGAKLHRRTLGLINGFTQRDPPPPPPQWPFSGGVSGGD